MSLHYLVKLKILISHVLPLNLSPKETQVFIPLQLLPPNSPDLNPVDNNMWGILQDIMYKTRITDLELSTTPLTNGCCNDDMTRLPTWFLVAVLVRPDHWCVFCTLSLTIFLTCCNQMDSNLGEFGDHSWSGINSWSFFLLQLNSSTCPTSILSFTR